MLKKILIVAAILVASPSLVLAQDIFWSFSPMTLRTSSSGNANGSFSAYILSDGLFGFHNLNLDFTTTNSDVIRFTGIEAFNPVATDNTGTRYTPGVAARIEPGTNSGFFLTVNGLGRAIRNPARERLVDPLFIEEVGPNGAFILARVDFDIVGEGTADLELSLGDNGALDISGQPVDPAPTFGSATLDTSLPIDDIVGDVNMDGDTNFFDIPAFIAVLISGVFQAEADINLDEEVNFGDIPPFVFILSNQ